MLLRFKRKYVCGDGKSMKASPQPSKAAPGGELLGAIINTNTSASENWRL